MHNPIKGEKGMSEKLPIISNEKIDLSKLAKATKIILGLQRKLKKYINKGYGPFMAVIYDQDGNLIAQAANNVINKSCSNNHAEMNAIKLAEKKLGTYDLSPYNLSIYITSEPCMMCLGGIMWSGIKAVYYGVPSDKVTEITGFDEGFKQNWPVEFKKRGIIVYGQIEASVGEQVLKDYVCGGHTIYKPGK